MLVIAVNNISKEQDFRERVRKVMIKQIKKKLVAEGRIKLDIVASHSSTKSNSIEQIQNQTV